LRERSYMNFQVPFVGTDTTILRKIGRDTTILRKIGSGRV